MADFLFFVKGTHGDLEPIWQLGPALKERGHQVTLFSHCSYANLAAQHGLHFVALDTPAERQSFLEAGRLLNSPKGFPAFYRQHILPKALSEYHSLAAHVRPGATVLISPNKSGPVPFLAAEKLAIPFVRLFVAPSELIALPLMGEMYRTILAQEVNALRQQIGLPPLADWQAWLRRPDRNLALWPAWFAAANADWPVEATPVGFLGTSSEEQPAPGEDIRRFLQAGEPPVLITAGTGLFLEARFYAASADACRLLGWRGILATRYPQHVPPNLPAQVKHFDFLPFGSLMPHTRAVIHHGGIGTLVQAMAAGIPQLILPSGADRPDNAARARALGIAAQLPMPRWKPEAVAETLKALVHSPDVQTRCHELAQRLRQAAARDEAGRLIETTLPAAQNASPTCKLDHPMQTPPKPQANDLTPEKRALLVRWLQEKRPGKAPVKCQSPASGPALLLPTQAMYLERYPHRHLYPDAPAIHPLRPPVDAACWQQAVQAVFEQHDILRAAYTYEGGMWRQYIHSPQEMALPFVHLDLAGKSNAAQKAIILEEIKKTIEQPAGPHIPLWKACLLDCGPEQNGYLLILINHLLSDHVSGLILAEDLQLAYEQVRHSEPINLPPVPMSFTEWAERLNAYARSDAQLQEADYWLALPWDQIPHLPADYPDGQGLVCGKVMRPVNRSLDPAETRAILQAIPQKHNVQVIDILHTAYVQTLTRWMGCEYLEVGSFRSGRDIMPAAGQADLSRTMGWLATNTVMVFQDDHPGDPLQALQSIRRQSQQIPNRGYGFRLLAYLSGNEAIARALKAHSKQEVTFNYVGRESGSEDFELPWEIRPEELPLPEGLIIGDGMGRIFLDCKVAVSNERLGMWWGFNERFHRRTTIEKLADDCMARLKDLIQCA
ncbi:MAG: condensation domain-containing protein [Chloroflexota bacterium]